MSKSNILLVTIFGLWIVLFFTKNVGKESIKLDPKTELRGGITA